MKKTLVILTLNEIEGVTALFDHIPWDAADESFVVDGGSQDGTREFFQERSVRVVEQRSRGRGEAFRIAFEESEGDVLCFFSPDGNEDPNDIPKLFAEVDKGADIAIARRFGQDANEEDDQALRLRAWANRAFTWLSNKLFNKGPYVLDTINGYRAIRREAWKQVRPDAAGFLIEYQMTMRAMKLGLTIHEIPTIERPRIGGESTAHSIPTGLRFVRGLIREFWLGKRF